MGEKEISEREAGKGGREAGEKREERLRKAGKKREKKEEKRPNEMKIQTDILDRMH